MRDSVFKLSYFLSANEKFHIARVNITSSQDLSLHSHDYAEILWVEKGTGIHHVNVRGEKRNVSICGRPEND